MDYILPPPRVEVEPIEREEPIDKVRITYLHTDSEGFHVIYSHNLESTWFI